MTVVVARHRVPATGKAKVKTTRTADSLVCLEVEPVTFAQLWASYPDESNPHKNANYKNQCAIRLSIALHGVEVDMRSFSERTVPKMPGKKQLGRDVYRKPGKQPREPDKPVALRAYEMATWLKQRPQFCGMPAKPQDITGKDWQTKVRGRTGIIYFFGYWRQEGDSGGALTGGHIDLWNGSRLTITSPLGAIYTMGRWAGIRTAFVPFTNIGYSDRGASVEILFWEIK